MSASSRILSVESQTRSYQTGALVSPLPALTTRHEISVCWLEFAVDGAVIAETWRFGNGESLTRMGRSSIEVLFDSLSCSYTSFAASVWTTTQRLPCMVIGRVMVWVRVTSWPGWIVPVNSNEPKNWSLPTVLLSDRYT